MTISMHIENSRSATARCAGRSPKWFIYASPDAWPTYKRGEP